jgi:hypothetical protein
MIMAHSNPKSSSLKFNSTEYVTLNFLSNFLYITLKKLPLFAI